MVCLHRGLERIWLAWRPDMRFARNIALNFGSYWPIICASAMVKFPMDTENHIIESKVVKVGNSALDFELIDY